MSFKVGSPLQVATIPFKSSVDIEKKVSEGIKNLIDILSNEKSTAKEKTGALDDFYKNILNNGSYHRLVGVKDREKILELLTSKDSKNIPEEDIFKNLVRLSYIPRAKDSDVIKAFEGFQNKVIETLLERFKKGDDKIKLNVLNALRDMFENANFGDKSITKSNFVVMELALHEAYNNPGSSGNVIRKIGELMSRKYSITE